MNLYNIIWIFIIAVLLKSFIKVVIFGRTSNKMNRAEYQMYLKSGKWRKKREEVFRKYGKECVLCGSQEHIIVHHRRYTHIGSEPMEDLIPLCGSCHNSYHKLARNRNRHI